MGQFDRPGGIISDSTGNIYVTDIGNSLVQKYNIGTKNWTVLGPAGHEIGQFAGPYGLSLDSTGDIYVADEYNHRIQKYDIGTTSWSVIGVGLSAALLKVDSTGNIYTGFGSNIYKYDIGTTSYTVIGTAGTGVGQFDIPGGMAVDSEDNLYVTDPYNHRIQKYDVGTTSWTIYSCSDGDGVCGDQPDGIDIDSIGNLYITDISTNRIQKLIYYPEPTPTPSITITPTDSISPSPSVSPSPTPLSYILTYSRQPNGSIFGESPQTVFFGGSGTEVLAVGDSGYTFLQWSDGSLDNPRIDVGVTGDISVSAEFTLARSFSSGVGLTMSNEVSEGNISIGGSVLTDTFNFTFNRAYIFDDILAEVAVPAGTVVTRSDSGSLNLNTFGISNVTSQVRAEKMGVLGALKVGIPDYGLTFSKNISLVIPVNISFNGRVFKVWYKSEGSSVWNQETTCLVIGGKCAFQTNHATTFAVVEDIVVNNNSSNRTQSPAGPPGPPVCTDSTPLFAPDLFQVNASKNSAKLYFTPLNDTNGRYYISFSAVNSNAEEHGEMVTLLKEGVQSHTIYKLKPNTIYYVKVRGQNGCMPGKWSTVMKFKTGSKLKIFYKYTAVKKVIKSIFGR